MENISIITDTEANIEQTSSMNPKDTDIAVEAESCMVEPGSSLLHSRAQCRGYAETSGREIEIRIPLHKQSHMRNSESRQYDQIDAKQG